MWEKSASPMYASFCFKYSNFLNECCYLSIYIFFKRNDFILSLINNMYHFFVTVILWHTNWLVIMMKYWCIRTYSIFRISDVISFSVRILAEEFLQHAMFLGEEISCGTGCLVRLLQHADWHQTCSWSRSVSEPVSLFVRSSGGSALEGAQSGRSATGSGRRAARFRPLWPGEPS